MTIFAYARVFGREEGKSELGWSRRSGPCILDSRDSFLGGGKERGKLCDADATRASETTAGGRANSNKKGIAARSLRHNGRMRYAATATHSSSLLPASPPLPLPFPFSPFPLLCHHVPRKSINTGTTRGPRYQGEDRKEAKLNSLSSGR